MKYIKEIRFMLDLFIGLSVPASYVSHAKKNTPCSMDPTKEKQP